MRYRPSKCRRIRGRHFPYSRMWMFARGGTRFNVCTASMQMSRFLAEKNRSAAFDDDGALWRYGALLRIGRKTIYGDGNGIKQRRCIRGRGNGRSEVDSVSQARSPKRPEDQ